MAMRIYYCSIGIAILGLLGASFSVSAAPLSAVELPPALLAACDEKTKPLESLVGPIRAAADNLINAGVLEREDFDGVKLGFCELRKANGPVATASCREDVILLDVKYADRSEALVRSATLAHEMKHILQHRELRAVFGESYCLTEDYAAGKPALEVEADAFGDKAAETLMLQGVYFRE